MTQEAMKMALEALEDALNKPMWNRPKMTVAITALEEALAQPEPVKISHKHEWFRTGEMKVGQMRCISCGTWGQEEMPQRTWVWLTKVERIELLESTHPNNRWSLLALCEAKLKEKNSL